MLIVASPAIGGVSGRGRDSPKRAATFAAEGVQLNVLAVVQSPTTCHALPLCISHLYCCGAAPPLGPAVNVIVVLAGCGAGLPAVNVTAVSFAVAGGGAVGGGVVVVVAADTA